MRRGGSAGDHPGRLRWIFGWGEQYIAKNIDIVCTG